MSEETLSEVFEPLVRAAPDVDAGGFGLGLPIVRGLVRNMSGTLNVESEVGSGTVFHVSLPLPETDGKIYQEVQSAEKPSVLPKSVIAVDDDRVLILVDPFVFPAVAHMNMAVDEIFGFVFFHQRTETFKTLMGKIFPVVEPPGGGMGQKNIEAFVADQFHPEFPDAGPHFFFGVLVRAVAVAHGTAKSEDTDPFVDIEIIIHTDAALGRVISYLSSWFP